MRLRLVEYTLGAEGLAWVRAALADGLSLAHHLLARPDLNRGRIVTLLPPDLPDAEVHDFQHGGRLPERPGAQRYEPLVDDTLPGVSDHTASRLCGLGRTLAVAENAMMRPTDKAMEIPGGPPTAVCGDEVYRFMISQDGSPEAVRDVIRYAEHPWPSLVCALGSLPDDEMRRWQGQRVQVDDDDFGRVAERAELLVIGAYDGESYLIWHAPGPP